MLILDASVLPQFSPSRFGWLEGPAPIVGQLRNGSPVTADRATRATFFDPRVVDVMYGDSHASTRFHLRMRQLNEGHPLTVAGVMCEYAELLIGGRSRHEDGASTVAQLVLHLTFADMDDATYTERMNNCVRDAKGRAEFVRRAAETFERIGVSLSSEGGQGPARIFSITWARFAPAPDLASRLWELSTLTNTSHVQPTPEQLRDVAAVTIDLSSDWAAVVLRDGAAFVMQSESAMATQAELLSATLYTDVLLLARLQLRLMRILEGAAASAVGDHVGLDRIADLEDALLQYRLRYWWRSVSSALIPNELLRAHQTQHDLMGRLADIKADVDGLGRIATARATARSEASSARTGAALGVLAVVGLPLSSAIGIWQGLGGDPVALVWVGAVSAIASVLIVLTVPGLRSLLSRPRLAQRESDRELPEP